MLSLNLPESALSELLGADDLVLMSETIERLRNKFLKLRGVFESKCLKVDLRTTSSRITTDGMSGSKVDTCGVYSLTVKTNYVLCVQCCRWIHG